MSLNGVGSDNCVLRSENSKAFEDMKYRLDAAIPKKLRALSFTESVRERLLSARSNVEKDLQRLPLYTEMLTVDVTNGFSGFLYCLSTDVKKLMEKHRKEIETTVKRSQGRLCRCAEYW